MKNIQIISLTFILFLFSCKKELKKNFNFSDKNNVVAKKENDSLKKIKDTTLFINSSEGEEVILFINTKTKDSIIESEVFGEMGKSEYKFIFNKTLKVGKCTSYTYLEPIYVSSNPKIKSKIDENLLSSAQTNKRLTDIFKSYQTVFKKYIPKNELSKFSDKWHGQYFLTLNENSEDWRNIHEIELNISKDSIIYLAKGYQLYQYYLLSAHEKGNSLFLTYNKSLDNTDSWALKNTKDFGIISLQGKRYILSSPYLDINFSSGNTEKYLLKK